MSAPARLAKAGCSATLRGAQPRAARAARGHRQLVRAPAGQALRRRHGRLGDGLLARHPLSQREDVHGDAADRPARAHADAARCSIQLFGEDPADHALGRRRAWRARGADAIDINMGCPVPKVRKTGAGAALLADPELARRRRAARSRRRRWRAAAGHRQAALRAAPGRATAASSSRTGWSRRRASPRSPFTPARRPCSTRACPTTRWRRASCSSLAAPVILTGGLSDAARVHQALRADRRGRR